MLFTLAMRYIIYISTWTLIPSSNAACTFQGYSNGATISITRIAEDIRNHTELKSFSGNNIAYVTTPTSSVTFEPAGTMYHAYIIGNMTEILDGKRRSLIDVPVILHCNGNERTYYKWTIEIRNVNNQPPIFSQPAYEYEIQLPWPFQSPINGDLLVVSDADYEQNIPGFRARLDSTFANLFRADINPLWSTLYATPDVHTYNIDIFLAASIDPGQYNFNITVEDNFGQKDSLNASTVIKLNVVSNTCVRDVIEMK